MGMFMVQSNHKLAAAVRSLAPGINVIEMPGSLLI